MAVTLVQKNLRRNGNVAQGHMTFFFKGGDTISGADFQVPANDGTGDTLTFVPRYIDKVIVFNVVAADPTVDGVTYESGTWDFFDMGGIPLSSSTSLTVSSGNILIRLRS